MSRRAKILLGLAVLTAPWVAAGAWYAWERVLDPLGKPPPR